jgi:hypothetical protein
MYEDKYKVISTGKLLPNVTYSVFKQAASEKYNIPDNTIDSLTNGVKKVLKRGVDFQSAKKYKDIFYNLGLDASLQIDLTKESFLSALSDVPVTIKNNVVTSLSIESQVVIPLVFSKSEKYELEQVGNDVPYSFKTNSVLGAPFVLFLTLFSMLHIQKYMLIVLSSHFSVDSYLPVIGISFLLIWLMYFPLIITNSRWFTLVTGEEACDVFKIREKNHLSLLGYKYSIKKNGICLGTIVKKRYKKIDIKHFNEKSLLNYFLVNGDVDTAHDSVHEMAGNVVTVSFFEYLFFLSYLRAIFNKIKNRNSEGSMSFLCFIRNRNNEVVARVYKGKKVMVEFEQKVVSEDKALLFVLSTMAAGLR